jgi:hypothetical protein
VYAITLVSVNAIDSQIVERIIYFFHSFETTTPVSSALSLAAKQNNKYHTILTINASVASISASATELYALLIIAIHAVKIREIARKSLYISVNDMAIRLFGCALLLPFCVFTFNYYVPSPPSPRFYCATSLCAVTFSVGYVCELFFIWVSAFQIFAAFHKAWSFMKGRMQ